MFKIGDRVKFIGTGAWLLNWEGTIIDHAARYGSQYWWVEFDRPTTNPGYSADGKGRPGCCWTIQERSLELLSMDLFNQQIRDYIRRELGT